METEDILLIGTALFAGYFYFFGNSEKKDVQDALAAEQFIGKATSDGMTINITNPETGFTTSIPKLRESELTPETILFTQQKSPIENKNSNINIDGQNVGSTTTYKVNVEELNPFQKWYVERGYWKIENDVLKPSIFKQKNENIKLTLPTEKRNIPPPSMGSNISIAGAPVSIPVNINIQTQSSSKTSSSSDARTLQQQIAFRTFQQQVASGQTSSTPSFQAQVAMGQTSSTAKF